MRRITEQADRTFASVNDLRDINDKLDRRLGTLETSIEASVSKLVEIQNDLKVAIQGAIQEINPIKTALNNKASVESHNSLERRVMKLEDSPNGVRNWLGLVVASSGCLISLALGIITIILGIIYFLATYKH